MGLIIMALIDLIATGKEAEQLLLDKADLQNQVDTAGLQHANDQQAIAGLKVVIATDEAIISRNDDQIEALAKQLQQAQMQLAALESVTVYSRLESNKFRSNPAKSVGGSGLGTGGWKAPGVECAELWVLDQAGVPAPNYVDCYNTQDFPPDPTKTRFRLEGSFMFPTAADIKACQCLEWEARQVFQGRMYIFAGQLQYSGGQLRYFDDIKKWTSTGTAITRPTTLQWVKVALEGRRDGANVQYDALELDGLRLPMTQSYVAQPTDWIEGLLRIGLQLDDSGAVDGYRVKIDDWKFTVSA